MLDLDFNYKKIINLVIIGIIFFGVFFLINPKKTNALSANEVNTLRCTEDQTKPYTSSDKFFKEDTGCGIFEKLSPRTNEITKKDVKKISDTEYEITFSWKVPNIYIFNNAIVNEFIIYVPTLLGGVSKTDWKFDQYELWINDGISNPTVKDISNFKQENDKWVYVHKIKFQKPPKDTGNLIQFTLIAKHHRTYGLLTGFPNDLWVTGTPQPVTIKKDGIDTNTSYYAPEIVSGEGKEVGTIGIATLKWKVPQAIKDKPQILSKYVFKRKKSTQNNWNVPEQEFKRLNYQETGFVTGDDHPINNLQNGQSISFDYFIGAKYNDPSIPNNFGWSTSSRRITFKKNAEGKVEVSDEGDIDPISNDVITGQTPEAGTLESTPTGCEANFCKNDMGKFPQDLVCRALCWVNEGIFALVNGTFEILKEAISTNTKAPYPSKFNEVMQKYNSTSGGSGAGNGTGNTSGGGGGTETPNPNNTSPTPTATVSDNETDLSELLALCKDVCDFEYREEFSSCPRGTAGDQCRKDLQGELALCELQCEENPYSH